MRHATEAEQARIMRVKARLVAGMKSELNTGEISPPEALAMFAYVTGMLVAMQDQRRMTAEEAMSIVGRNIEQGNASVIEQLFSGPGGTA